MPLVWRAPRAAEDGAPVLRGGRLLDAPVASAPEAHLDNHNGFYRTPEGEWLARIFYVSSDEIAAAANLVLLHGKLNPSDMDVGPAPSSTIDPARVVHLEFVALKLRRFEGALMRFEASACSKHFLLAGTWRRLAEEAHVVVLVCRSDAEVDESRAELGASSRVVVQLVGDWTPDAIATTQARLEGTPVVFADLQTGNGVFDTMLSAVKLAVIALQR